ncbi:MAG: HDOD domain-containing protein [Anaerolineaceae bacterium]|nr:HDOD domain-containing protein [Anaerolineaceae bacterium]
MASLFAGEGLPVAGFSPSGLWRHSVATGVTARSIVSVAGFHSLREEAFLAGIIHDIGILVEYQFAGDKFAQLIGSIDQGTTLLAAEQKALDMTHQQIGQALAELWKFPRNMQLVIGYHHEPTRLAEEHRLLPVAVALAEGVSNDCGFGFLAAGSEAEMPDDQALCEIINVGLEDVSAIRETLPEMVEQASGWLEV